jgi:HSP20 family protein
MAYWDPFEDLSRLRRRVDRLWDEGMERADRARVLQRRSVELPLDVYSTPEEIVIQASVPGLDPQDVHISLEGDKLIIRGEIRPPLENVDYWLQERSYGPFARTLVLNTAVEADAAEAAFDRGVLTLTIPKAESARPRVIKVRAE